MSRPDYWKDCTVECEATQRCTVCGRLKLPVGRSAPMAMHGSRCDSHECEGYWKDPAPGHLWPGEIKDMDAPASAKDGE